MTENENTKAIAKQAQEERSKTRTRTHDKTPVSVPPNDPQKQTKGNKCNVKLFQTKQVSKGTADPPDMQRRRSQRKGGNSLKDYTPLSFGKRVAGRGRTAASNCGHHLEKRKGKKGKQER